ncbi:MAG: hypothetical protein VXZ44_03100 [Verrucomicrobiota bacterium]|nr:hypothetical protein [Verrucomicrobiota bacterium]
MINIKFLIFLFTIIILFLSSIYCIFIGWFPSDSTLNKYPIYTDYYFSKSGKINQFFVDEKSRVFNGDKVCELYDKEFEELKSELSSQIKKRKMTERALLNAINNGATINFIKGLEAKNIILKKEIEEIEEQIVLKNQKLIITFDHEFGGTVQKIHKNNGDQINTNEKVVTIKLYQSYYSTFKILSCILIVSLFGTLYFYKKK